MCVCVCVCFCVGPSYVDTSCTQLANRTELHFNSIIKRIYVATFFIKLFVDLYEEIVYKPGVGKHFGMRVALLGYELSKICIF